MANELVDEEFGTTYKSINTARNKFAHRLVFEVPGQDDGSTSCVLSPGLPALPCGDRLSQDTAIVRFVLHDVSSADQEAVFVRFADKAQIAE